MVTKLDKFKAGHAEIQGETIAKFELFEQGFNPYSRYLDVDKVDLILRKRKETTITYREVQVKYGRLWHVGKRWEQVLFDVTSWKFFKPDEFKDSNHSLFVVYVLALPPPEGYQGDLFIFPARKFHELINHAPSVNSKKGIRKEVFLSRALGDGKWYWRTKMRFTKEEFKRSVIPIEEYRRNFSLLE